MLMAVVRTTASSKFSLRTVSSFSRSMTASRFCVLKSVAISAIGCPVAVVCLMSSIGRPNPWSTPSTWPPIPGGNIVAMLVTENPLRSQSIPASLKISGSVSSSCSCCTSSCAISSSYRCCHDISFHISPPTSDLTRRRISSEN